jgi:hypothetical protein
MLNRFKLQHLIKSTILFCLLFPLLGFGQSLVSDGGFENITNLPKAHDRQISPYMSLEKWIPVIRKTESPSVMHPKIIKWYKLVDQNFNPKKYSFYGNFPPKSGKGFVGISIYHTEHPKGLKYYTRSYIQTKLNSKLKKGTTYHFEMWVRTSNESSKYFSSGLGINLTDSIISYGIGNLKEHYYIGAKPQIRCDSIISNTTEWNKVEGNFTAKGGEQYLTIGNFSPDSNLSLIENENFIRVDEMAFKAKIFIDEISLTELNK